MKLEITLTDEQSAEIKAALLKTESANPIEPTMPDPPEGFHPAMMGLIPHQAQFPNTMDVVMFSERRKEWHDPGWEGGIDGRFYALRIGSEIARLNGLEPEAIPALPESRKAKEWDASVVLDGTLVEHGIGRESVRVREIIPGEPTPEHVQVLISMLEKSLEEHRKVNGYLATRIKNGESLHIWKCETWSVIDGIEQTLAPFCPEKK